MLEYFLYYLVVGLFVASLIIYKYKPWYAEISTGGYIMAVILWPVFVFAVFKGLWEK